MSDEGWSAPAEKKPRARDAQTHVVEGYEARAVKTTIGGPLTAEEERLAKCVKCHGSGFVYSRVVGQEMPVGTARCPACCGGGDAPLGQRLKRDAAVLSRITGPDDEEAQVVDPDPMPCAVPAKCMRCDGSGDGEMAGFCPRCNGSGHEPAGPDRCEHGVSFAHVNCSACTAAPAMYAGALPEPEEDAEAAQRRAGDLFKRALMDCNHFPDPDRIHPQSQPCHGCVGVALIAADAAGFARGKASR